MSRIIDRSITCLRKCANVLYFLRRTQIFLLAVCNSGIRILIQMYSQVEKIHLESSRYSIANTCKYLEIQIDSQLRGLKTRINLANEKKRYISLNSD